MNKVTFVRPALFVLLLLLTFLPLNESQAQNNQIDNRFGTVGREAAARLGMPWYREYQRHNDLAIPAGAKKPFVVGQLSSRSDDLGIDWEWYLLDLLEQPGSLLMQHFLNLVLDVVHSDAIPVIRQTWEQYRPELETQWEQTVNGTSKTWKKKVFGVTIYSYTVRLSDTQVSIPEQFPEVLLNVAPNGDGIVFTINLVVNWTTQARGTGGSIHASPTFTTNLSIQGTIGISEDEQGRYLSIREIHGNSVTDAEGNITFTVNILNIGNVRFTWRKLDILIQSQIDNTIAGAVGKLMEIDTNQDGQADLAKRVYFESFLSTTFFDGKPLPRQQEILDRIAQAETEWIRHKIVDQGYRGRYWEIGNEPNWFPLMRPEQYAQTYERYYRTIKELDPTAKCMIGGLFLKEAIENPLDIVMLLIPPLAGPFREDLANFISQSLFSTSTSGWLESFYAALPPDVKVDVGNFHVYPMKANSTAFDMQQVQPQIEALAAAFKAHGAQEIWISEMGNLDWRRSEEEVAQMATEFSSYLKSNAAGITRWFWSRSIGYDHRFDTIGQQPFTALLANDGQTLTKVGKAYETASQGMIDHRDDKVVAEGEDALEAGAARPPERVTLAANYPNPFSTSNSGIATTIRYGLPEESEVRLQVFDLLGRMTREILNSKQGAGWHEIGWDGRDETGGAVSSGTYVMILQAQGKVERRKLVVLR